MERKLFTRRYKWWKLLSLGCIAYILGLMILVITSNPNLFPSIVILGNFLIPVTYVAFFYERRRLSTVNLFYTAVAFFYGGFLGTFFASVLEPIFVRSMDLRSGFIIGTIEEFAKMIGVVLILHRKRHDLELDGLILGAAAGMGFAALESTGYAFTAFFNSYGSLSFTVYITLLRGLLSPLGHGTWTAILSAVLLRELGKKRFHINFKVVSAFFTVVALHGLWDGLPTIISQFTTSDMAIMIGQISIGFIGIIILFQTWREAIEQIRGLKEGLI